MQKLKEEDRYRGRDCSVSVEKFLDTFDVFGGLEDSRKNSLYTLFSLKRVQPGTVIATQGKPWDQVIGVVGGKVEILMEFDLKVMDRHPFNNYIKQQTLVA